MKKVLVFVMALVLTCGMLVSCDDAQTMIEKADAALAEAPYTMTMKMDFACDNEEINELFSMMNMEIPVTVDGKNLAMDMSMEASGYTTDIKVIVADMMMYYDIEMMNQSVKMKAAMDEEQYKKFMSDSNAEMTVNPEDFGTLTVESKDGKKYIACGEISEEGLKELNDMMEESLQSLGGEASVSDVTYGIVLNDGKYESMEMTCIYSVTVAGESCNVTFKMRAEFSYDDVAAITVPEDAEEYQEMDFDELMG